MNSPGDRNTTATAQDGTAARELNTPAQFSLRDEVAVVILARNEQNTIEDAVRGAVSFCSEVHVMDGHSTDLTRERARAAGAQVHQDNGRGKGAAIRHAISLTQRSIIVFMDADGSHSPADIPRLTAPISGGEMDMVVGSRFTGGSDEVSVSVSQLIRTIGNISMNIAINKRFGSTLTDTLNGFRAVRTDVIRALDLKEDRHTIEQEMVIQALRRGYQVTNVPTHEFAREFGDSTINIWREWPIFVGCLVYNLLQPDVVCDRVRSPAYSPATQAVDAA